MVYKVVLSDNRVIAVKYLNESSKKQGEVELQAELSTLRRLNHMSLIAIWGYCAESKHNLQVYEYMENGLLAQNLHSNKLVWDKKFDIGIRHCNRACIFT